MKIIFVLLLFIINTNAYDIFSGIKSGINYLSDKLGSARDFIIDGSSAGEVPSITPTRNLDNSFGGSGKVSHGVNLLNGQPNFSIPLGGINVHEVAYPFVLNYFGNTGPVFHNDNEHAPTSWVGLGFNLTVPYIAINHKGTFSYSDDVVYCNLGPYGSGQLLVDNQKKYFLSSNPFIKIEYQTGTTGDLNGQFTKWVFTFTNGKKMVFGENVDAQRYVMFNNATIIASPNPNIPAKKFIYRWDISSLYDTIPSLPPKNKILFTYNQFTESVLPNKSYVREAFIKDVKWVEGSQEVERYSFNTANKGTSEYVGYTTNEPKSNQKLFETQHIDNLKCYKEGQLTHYYQFDWTSQTKGLLSKIRVFYLNPNLNAKQDSGWTFQYYGPENFYLVKSATYPSGKTDTYSYANYGSDVGLEGDINITKRKDSNTNIPLPSAAAELSKWKNESSCDERMCYLVIKDRDNVSIPGDVDAAGMPIKQKMYLEIRRHLSNFFDPRSMDGQDTVTLRMEFGDSASKADDWQFIPAGNYFTVVNHRNGIVRVFEFNGIKWIEQFPFAGDTRYNTTTGFGDSAWVYPTSSYFVVLKRSGRYSRESIIAYNGESWTSLNRNINACQFDNKTSYGRNVRPASGSTSCMDWYKNGGPTTPFDALLITVSPNFFAISHAYTGVVNVYALSGDANVFKDITKKMGLTGDINQVSSTSPFLYTSAPDGLYSTENMLYLASHATYTNPGGSNSPAYLNCFFFDGDSLLGVGGKLSKPGIDFQSVLSVFPGPDYVIVGSILDGVHFGQLKETTNGKVGFPSNSFVHFQGWSTPNINTGIFMTATTTAKAFALEFYQSTNRIGYRPEKDWPNETYSSKLYQVDRTLTNGFQNITSQVTVNGLPLYNISFSGSDNMISGRYGEKSSSPATICTNDTNTVCNYQFYAGRIHPEKIGTGFVTDLSLVPHELGFNAGSTFQENFSNSARVGYWSILDKTNSAIYYQLYQFNGKGFGSADSQFVVDKVKSSSNIGSADKDNITYQFGYNSPSLGYVQFNPHTQSMQFELADVYQTNSAAGYLGVERTLFYLDSPASPLSGKETLLNGIEKYTAIAATNGDTTTILSTINPYHASTWPAPLFLIQKKSTVTLQVASNKSRIADTTSYYNFSPVNGRPQFVLNQNGAAKLFLSQTMQNALGFSIQANSYRLSSTLTANERAALDNPANANAVYTNAKAIPLRSSQSTYSSYFPVSSSIWRPKDTRTLSQLKTGVEQTYSLSSGWLPEANITLRDVNNPSLVLESKAIKNISSNAIGETYISNFYEGLRCDIIGTISNSKLENCAMLTAENGNVNTLNSGYFDTRNKWARAGGVFSADYSHTGRYSIMVTNNFGPSINILLKDMPLLKTAYKVSAWIYAPAGSTPILAVETRKSDNSLKNLYLGNPTGWSGSINNQWQRWEIILPYEALIDGGLFSTNNSNDYLRIWVGTGGPTSNNNNTVFVDDIVCMPITASFSLFTYDGRGLRTSVTNSDFFTTYFDLGNRGDVIATRDDKGRIFNQTGFHYMGEN